LELANETLGSTQVREFLGYLLASQEGLSCMEFIERTHFDLLDAESKL
jgi:hypothetical protein